jgi:hypothetical protein
MKRYSVATILTFVAGGSALGAIFLAANPSGTQAGEPPVCTESFQRMAGLSGHWTGTWMNHTFQSSGNLTVDAIVNADCTAVATVTGLFMQPERTLSAEYSDDSDGTMVTVEDDPVVGDASLHVDADGDITIEGSGAQQGIQSYTGTGTMTGIDISLDLTLNFQGGGSATESVELRKQVTLVQGDLNCDDSVDAHDALRIVLHETDLLGFRAGCLRVAQDEIDLFAWGDVNCDDAIDTDDGIAILLHAAGVGAAAPGDCTPIGQEFNG